MWNPGSMLYSTSKFWNFSGKKSKGKKFSSRANDFIYKG